MCVVTGDVIDIGYVDPCDLNTVNVSFYKRIDYAFWFNTSLFSIMLWTLVSLKILTLWVILPFHIVQCPSDGISGEAPDLEVSFAPVFASAPGCAFRRRVGCAFTTEGKVSWRAATVQGTHGEVMTAHPIVAPSRPQISPNDLVEGFLTIVDV